MNGRVKQRSDELHRCPVCHGTYVPDYPSRFEAPAGTIGREQYETKICSRACKLANKNGAGSV